MLLVLIEIENVNNCWPGNGTDRWVVILVDDNLGLDYITYELSLLGF